MKGIYVAVKAGYYCNTYTIGYLSYGKHVLHRLTHVSSHVNITNFTHVLYVSRKCFTCNVTLRNRYTSREFVVSTQCVYTWYLSLYYLRGVVDLTPTKKKKQSRICIKVLYVNDIPDILLISVLVRTR